VVITGHISGYLRYYNVYGDGTIKMINRIKISNLPITNITISPDASTFLVTDSGLNCFMLAGISKDCLVLG